MKLGNYKKVVQTQRSHFQAFSYLESVREATVFTKLPDDLLELSSLDVSTLLNPLVEHRDNGNPSISKLRNPTVQRVICRGFSGVEEDSENPRNARKTPWN